MSSPDLPQGGAPNTIPLLLGHPDPATLLTPELRLAMEHVISSPHSYAALQYGPEQGTQNLIEVLVEKINREQELSLQPGNLMAVAGSTHAVDMLARLYGRPGGVVLVEAPTYADALHIFRDHHMEMPENFLDGKRISHCFLQDFFAAICWFMWFTAMAF